MGNSLLAWQNVVRTSVLTASNADPALPVTNLRGDQGSAATGWQTTPGATSGVLLTITPATRTAFRVLGAFRTNLTTNASFVSRMYTNPGASLLRTDISIVNAGKALVVLPSDVAADYVTFTLSDVSNPQNFLNVPLVYAGPAWIPQTGMSFATTMGRTDQVDTITTRGGQTYVSLRATAKRWEIALDGVRASEVYAQLDALDRISRTGGNVLGVPDFTSPNATADATFGIITPSADIGYPYGGADRRSWRAHLIERL